jgi:predicted Zn finger-like uncharacterized protein
MKVVCDSCRTQYLVPDEKVGPRGIKIRCKKCGHIIIWRPAQEAQEPQAQPQTGPSLSSVSDPFAEKSGEGDELGQAFDRLLQGAPAPSTGSDEEDDDEDGGETQLFSLEDLQRFKKGSLPADDQQKIDAVFSEASSTSVAAGRAEVRQEWYVAVRDEQLGPVSREELEGYWNRGEINAQTLAWCQGMADWEPIENIAQLKYLLAAPSAATAPSKAEKQWVETASSSLTSLVEEELQAVASKPPPAEAKDSARPDQAEGEGGAEEIPPWEKEEVVSGEVPRPGGGYFDPSLSLTTTATGSPLPRKTALEKPAYLAKGSGLGGWKMILAAGGGALIGAVAIFLVIWGGGRPAGRQDVKGVESAPPVADKAQAAAAEAKPEKPQASESKEPPAAPEQGAEKAASPQEDVIVAQKPKKETAPPPAEEKEKAKPAARGEKASRPTAVAAKAEKARPEPKEKPAPPPAATPEQGGQLTKEQVAATMKKYLPVMKNCVAMQKERDPSVTGTMIISFVILPSGKTSEVKVQTPEHQGTFVASCILRVISEINFPTFSGPPYPIPRLPLKLGD